MLKFLWAYIGLSKRSWEYVKTKEIIPFLESISTHIADQAHKSSFQLFKVLISLKYWFSPAADKEKYEKY